MLFTLLTLARPASSPVPGAPSGRRDGSGTPSAAVVRPHEHGLESAAWAGWWCPDCGA
jgi:hypothetical protein